MIKQRIPNGLILRALQQYQEHLKNLKAGIGEELFYSMGTNQEDEFDLFSEIPMIENSEMVELTMNEDIKKNWHMYCQGGVDYPEYIWDEVTV